MLQQTFTEKVYRIVARIPEGKVMTYGQVAVLAGSAGAARAVGMCMKNNPDTTIVPCHRVVASNGDLTGYSGGQGVKTKEVMQSFLTNPEIVSVKNTDINTNVHQKVVELNGRNKRDVLCELLNNSDLSKVLIFTRTKRGADSLHKSLSKNGYRTTVMHGNKSQHQRQKSLQLFRQGKANILIATDVASRGIDVDDISHVINHDLPETYEDYIHRIGRTGRADKKGTALSFVN